MVNSILLGVAHAAVDGKSAASAFTSLGQARNITSAGVYYFNVSGKQFSTYVDMGGWVQVAVDSGGTAASGALVQGTALTATGHAILNATTLAAFTGLSDIRIKTSAAYANGSCSPAQNGAIDVTTTSTAITNNIATNTTLFTNANKAGYSSNPNPWVGANAAYFNGNTGAQSQYGTALNNVIFHKSGDANSFYWASSGGTSARSCWNSGDAPTTMTLQLFARAPATSVGLVTSKVTTSGTGTFGFSGTNGYGGDSIPTTAANTARQGVMSILTSPTASTTITETPASGYELTGVTCTGVSGTPTVNLTSGTVTFTPNGTLGSNVTCTFTNALKPPDISVALNIPTASGPGAAITGTITCSNATGAGSAANPTCDVSASGGVTVTKSACTYSSGSSATSLAAGGTMTCPISYTMPGTVGGADTPQTSVTLTGTTSTSTANDPTANTTTTVTTDIVDAINDTTTQAANATSITTAVAGNDQGLGNKTFVPIATGATAGGMTSTCPGIVTTANVSGAVTYNTPAKGFCTVVYGVCANNLTASQFGAGVPATAVVWQPTGTTTTQACDYAQLVVGMPPVVTVKKQSNGGTGTFNYTVTGAQ